jgi:hypothetical protein
MRSTVQTVALVFGVVFILVAILGFLTDGGTSMGVEDPGMVLGLFPVNLLHNIVHLLFGVWGIAASRRWDASVQYCRIGGIIYIVLTILGLIAPTTFGLIPIGGNDIWLHALLGIALAAVGFTARRPAGAPTS